MCSSPHHQKHSGLLLDAAAAAVIERFWEDQYQANISYIALHCLSVWIYFNRGH